MSATPTTLETAPARITLTPVLIALLAALSAFAPLSVDMYLPALPVLTSDFRATDADTQLTLTAFMLAFGFGQIFYGPLGDRYGRAKILSVCVLLYSVFTGLSSFSTGFVDFCAYARPGRFWRDRNE